MYSPKIDPGQVRKLYLLKASYAAMGINKPMTEMVGEALEEYIPGAARRILDCGGSVLMPDELEVKQ